jgi:hypothetical protein
VAGEDPNARREQKRFEVALQTRQFEIELFWKRALFFWGFIAAAFVAVAALKDERPILSLIIAGFGVVCSFAWALVNRGSKYWQEQWESKIGKVEDFVTGPLFDVSEPAQEKGSWLRGRQYSVSKVAIAVSDYVLFVWVCIFIRQIVVALGPGSCSRGKLSLIIALSAVPIVYATLLAGFAKTTSRNASAANGEHDQKRAT